MADSLDLERSANGLLSMQNVTLCMGNIAFPVTCIAVCVV